MKKIKLFFLLFALEILNVSGQCTNDLYQGYGGSHGDQGASVATDPAGNAYISGVFSDSIVLGNYTLTTPDTLGIFLAKISAAGNVVWAKKITSGYAQSYNPILKLNATGQLLMAGTCTNNHSDFDTLSQPFLHGDIYIGKFNCSTGALEDFLSTGNHGYSWVIDMETDAYNNILVTGGFVGQIYFGAIGMVCTGTTNTFLVRFDASLQAQWARRVTNVLTSGNTGDHLAYDPAGKIYVAGWYGSACDFGNGIDLHSPSFSNGYLAKYDTLGNIIWARTSVPGFIHNGLLLLDSASLLVLRDSPSAFVLYNQLGDTLWTKTISDNAYPLFQGLIKNENKIFGLGRFTDHLLLGDSTFVSAGNHIFMSRFSLDGTFDWMRPVTTVYGVNPSAIGIDTSGNIHLVGSYQFADTFDFIHPMPAHGSMDIFYLRLCRGAVTIDEYAEHATLVPYPVPFADHLTIGDTRAGGALILYDMLGVEVARTVSAAGQTVMATDKLLPGMYFLRYTDGKSAGNAVVVKD